jgi:hypothetical protein
MKRKWKLAFLVPLGICGFLLFIALGGEIVMQLWNWLLPPLFGLREVTFWQALGLLALCRILFGGFAGPRFRRTSNMTPEERARFRQRIRERCGLATNEPLP